MSHSCLTSPKHISFPPINSSISRLSPHKSAMQRAFNLILYSEKKPQHGSDLFYNTLKSFKSFLWYHLLLFYLLLSAPNYSSSVLQCDGIKNHLRSFYFLNNLHTNTDAWVQPQTPNVLNQNHCIWSWGVCMFIKLWGPCDTKWLENHCSRPSVPSGCSECHLPFWTQYFTTIPFLNFLLIL